jgi:hypothetical protein
MGLKPIFAVIAPQQKKTIRQTIEGRLFFS